MSVNAPNPGNYVISLGQHTTQFRDALQTLLNDAAYINEQGGATFLTGSLGIDETDAASIVSTIGSVTPGNSVVESIQAFIASTVFLWGGN